MLSEAIHSLVDTGNGALMLYGIRRSQKPTDRKHRFGYGREIYLTKFFAAGEKIISRFRVEIAHVKSVGLVEPDFFAGFRVKDGGGTNLADA